MYINTQRPSELKSTRKSQRMRRDGQKEFSEEIESIMDTVTIESLDPDKKNPDDTSAQDKNLPEKPKRPALEGNLNVTV